MNKITIVKNNNIYKVVWLLDKHCEWIKIKKKILEIDRIKK